MAAKHAKPADLDSAMRKMLRSLGLSRAEIDEALERPESPAGSRESDSYAGPPVGPARARSERRRAQEKP